MRKTIFMLFSSFLVVALVAVIPAELAAAKRVSPPQPTEPVSAQQADIEALIEDILLELNQAKGMTTDQGVIDEIDGIMDAVRKLEWLEFTNQEEDALRLKYIIAEQLEKLINELPLATAGVTTAVAAVPASNPLYEELVKVRAKIERLIELETPSLEITPVPPPTISRVPETERLIVYSAKFLCGPAFGKEGVQRGSYSTAINVHNPHNGTVYLYKKAVIAKREDEPRGRISDFRKVVLGPDEAIEIDCIDVYSLLGPEPDETDLSAASQQPETGLTVPSIQTSAISPVSSLVRFVKGFVVIYASAPLDVVAVYTASTTVGFSLDVEYLSPSTTATVPVTEEEECPQGCRCLTRKEAAESGLTAPCNGVMTICEYDDQQNPLRYCFGKPPEQVPCPQGCECLSLTPAEAERLGYSLCNGRETVCGYDAQQNRMLCYEKTTEVECPQGCVCLAETVADGLDYPLCDGEKTWCGTDSTGIDMYCYERTTQVECPQGCECLALTPAAVEEKGLVQCLDVSCGTDAAGNMMYCYREPTQVECPQGCECLALTPAAVEEKGLVQCLDVSCGTDAAGNMMYCYREPTQVECPQGCECLALTPAEAEEKGLVQCLDVSCGTDAAGNMMYCYEETTEAECPQGCECLSEIEARKLGYSLCGGQYIPCDYVPGGPQKWCYEPAVATRLTIEPSQDSNLIGTEHTVTVLVYDKYGNPLPNAKVTITVSGVHSLGPVTLTTNTSGKAVFEYTGKSAGTDTIVATVDGLQATAFKTWYQRGQQ